MHNNKKGNYISVALDGLIQIHKQQCEEFKAFSDAIHPTLMTFTIDLIVTCPIHQLKKGS